MLEKFKEWKAKAKGKIMVASAAASAAVVSMGVTAFASESGGGPSIVITEAMLTPVTEGVTANLAVILPVGLSLFAMFTAVKLVPKMIKLFLNT